MRIAIWDSSDPEMYFANPYLRWGSPSHLLAPGERHRGSHGLSLKPASHRPGDGFAALVAAFAENKQTTVRLQRMYSTTFYVTPNLPFMKLDRLHNSASIIC